MLRRVSILHSEGNQSEGWLHCFQTENRNSEEKYVVAVVEAENGFFHTVDLDCIRAIDGGPEGTEAPITVTGDII